MAAPLHLIPPNHSPHGPEQSPLSSPTHNASSTNLNASVGNISSDVLLERSEIDKSLKALETIVGVLYDYAKLWQNLVGLDKKLVKSLKDAGTFKGQVEWPNAMFQSSSQIFEVIAECDTKYSKLVEREYETSNGELKKWLKKLKKEDKSLEEFTANAQSKLKSLAPSTKSKKLSPTAALQSLEYSSLLSQLTHSLQQAKYQHSLFISTKHLNALYTISSALGRVADGQWAKGCESVKRCSPFVGGLTEARMYVEGGWRGTRGDLKLNLPVSEGTVNDEGERTLKAKDGTATTAAALPISTPLSTTAASQGAEEKSHSTPIQPSGANTAGRNEKASSTDVLQQIAKELGMPTQASKPAEQETRMSNTKEDKSAVDVPTVTSPATVNEKEMAPIAISKDQTPSSIAPSDARPKPSSTTNPANSGTTTSTNTVRTATTTTTDVSGSTSTSAKDTVASASDRESPVLPKAFPVIPKDTMSVLPALHDVKEEKGKAKEVERKASFEHQQTLARTPINVPVPTLSKPDLPIKTPLNDPLDRPDSKPPLTPLMQQELPPSFQSPSTGGPMNPRNPLQNAYFPHNEPSNQAGVGSSNGPRPFQPTHRSNTSIPGIAAPPPMPAPGTNPAPVPGSYPNQARPVGRTMSIDSTTSNGSHVAAMRERYSSPPPSHQRVRDQPPPQGWTEREMHNRGGKDNSATPTAPGRIDPRDREYGGGRVTEMASRFTPIEGPIPQHAATFNQSTFVMGPERGQQRRGWSPPREERQGGELPLRQPLVDEFGTHSSKGRGETMPNLGRPSPGVNTSSSFSPGSLPAGSGSVGTPGGTSVYDIQFSELELQRREMELEMHRQRLQLEREKEALMRERQQRDQMQGRATPEYGGKGAEYGTRGDHNPRSGGYGSMRGDGYTSDRGYGTDRPGPSYRRNTVEDERYVGGGGYHGNRDEYPPQRPYLSPSPYSNDWSSPNPSDHPHALHTPQLNSGRSFSHLQPSAGGGGRDLSTGLGVMGLGLPPEVGTAASRSRESLRTEGQELTQRPREEDASSAVSYNGVSTTSRSNAKLSTPTDKVAKDLKDNETGKGRKSADGGKDKEKEKGGTWLGKGLKRFSLQP